MADKFENHVDHPLGVPTGLIDITPDDGSDLPDVVRGLNVAQSGAVRVTMIDGSVGTVTVAAGIQFGGRFRKVWSTGTDATGIVGLI